jgi:hypothetical protein
MLFNAVVKAECRMADAYLKSPGYTSVGVPINQRISLPGLKPALIGLANEDCKGG